MCCIIKEVLHILISEEEHIHFSREKVRQRTKTLRMPPRVFPPLSKALLPLEDSVVTAAAVATAATAVVDDVDVVVVLDVVDVSAVVVFVVA